MSNTNQNAEKFGAEMKNLLKDRLRVILSKAMPDQDDDAIKAYEACCLIGVTEFLKVIDNPEFQIPIALLSLVVDRTKEHLKPRNIYVIMLEQLALIVAEGITRMHAVAAAAELKERINPKDNVRNN
jgi:hypothetical protein